MKLSTLRKLQKVMGDYQGVIGIAVFGPETATPESLELAVKMGVADPKDPKPGFSTLLHAFGTYMATSGPKVSETRLDEFRAIVKAKGVPQTEQERASAEHVQARGAIAMTNSGLRSQARVGDAAGRAHTQGYADLRSIVRDALAARFGDLAAQERVAGAAAPGFVGDVHRKTVGQVVSDLGHLTSEWLRDLQRIVQTELTAAVAAGQEARWTASEAEVAEELQRPPADPLVYKLPRPGHCKHCARLHLDGEYPRIYLLSEVQANGDNVGRKAPDWRMVIGPVHPWCACTLMRVPSFVEMPPGWSSGQAAPTVIGIGGRLV